MATPTDADSTGPRSAGGAGRILAGVGAVIAVLVVLVLPAVTMLVLPPRGFPTTLPDGLGLALLAGAGIVVAGTARLARTWPPFAAVVAGLMLLVALWFQTTTWLRIGAVPTPPILPNVPPTLVLVAGVLFATAATAFTTFRGAREVDDGSPSTATTSTGWRPSSVGLGVAAALVVVTVVEGDIWGRRRLRETFEAPWGLDLFTWLTLLFIAVLLAGGLLGWLAGSAHARPAAATGATVLGLTILAIWIGAGLDGPPRTTLYGLSLGLLALPAIAPTRAPRAPTGTPTTAPTPPPSHRGDGSGPT